MNFFLNFKSLFEQKDYYKIVIIIFLILAVTSAEILGIAAIIPFITIVLAPERFENIEFTKFFVTLNSYNHNQKLIIFRRYTLTDFCNTLMYVVCINTLNSS